MVYSHQMYIEYYNAGFCLKKFYFRLFTNKVSFLVAKLIVKFSLRTLVANQLKAVLIAMHVVGLSIGEFFNFHRKALATAFLPEPFS